VVIIFGFFFGYQDSVHVTESTQPLFPHGVAKDAASPDALYTVSVLSADHCSRMPAPAGRPEDVARKESACVQD
jgi:hypothetical protein